MSTSANRKTIKLPAGETFAPISNKCKSCGYVELTLHVDCSALKAQTQVVEAVSKRYLPLIEKVPGEIVEVIIGKLIIELRALVFSYNVTTISTDSSRKTVRTFRYRGAIEEFATAFWARDLNFVHL